MTKIDIISGFLGAGKTTLIKKLLKELYVNEQVVLIENEFGEIGIDGGFLKEAGIEIREMNSGCICCSLVGDFGSSLREVYETYKPDRIIIEPSGVGKLSDVMKAVEGVTVEGELELNSAIVVVDATKCKTYLKNFGEFFANQITYAQTIILSRTDKFPEEKMEQCVSLIREINSQAVLVTTPWKKLDGTGIREAMEHSLNLEAELLEEMQTHEHDHHHEDHHHDHDHGADCTCGCHHDHAHEHEHEHENDHAHENDHHYEDHHEDHHHEDHHHDHDHGADCTCGCHHDHEHDHHHNHDHHAGEVFGSWGIETPSAYTEVEIEKILSDLEDQDKYGYVLRAKGMVASEGDSFVHFDYVPGESNVREGVPHYTGKICVIGAGLKKENLQMLFAKR